jgi:hypothetical protein
MSQFIGTLKHLISRHNVCVVLCNGMVVSNAENCGPRPALGTTWDMAADVRVLFRLARPNTVALGATSQPHRTDDARSITYARAELGEPEIDIQLLRHPSMVSGTSQANCKRFTQDVATSRSEASAVRVWVTAACCDDGEIRR